MGLTDSMLSDRRILEGLEDIKKQLDPETFKMLIALLYENKGNELQVLRDMTQYTYREKPVSMEKFLLDDYYLGLKGQLYPTLVEDLCEMFEGGYDEAVLAGGIGWGKSTVAECALVRMVYEVSCYRNPQAVFDLAEGTRITFVNVSLNQSHAEDVVFHGIKTKLMNSPYFNENFLYDKNLKTEMLFPNNIVVMPTTNPIGHNVFGGVLDEVNFMSVVEQSTMARGGKYDQAENLHDNVIRRMKSRYMKRGKLPGLLLSISSSKYPDDFTERMFEKAETDDSIFTRRYSQWGTKPKSFFIGETFKVSLGDGGSSEPKVLEEDWEVKKAEKSGVKIIDVPIEYKNDFLTDLDGSIRDLAGYPTLTILPFLRQRDKIFDAISRGETDYHLQHPFTKIETTLEDGATFDLDKLQKHDYPCFIHNDLSLSGDSSGFCMGHVAGYKQVIRRNEEGVEFSIQEPVIVIDFMLKITAPHKEEIQLSNVRSLVFELQSYGFNIQKVTYDQFQCFTGDTEIETVHHGKKTFHELIEEGVKEIEVFAYDKENERITVAKAKNIRKTGENAQLVKVTLDNGEEIRCTPDHRFMLRDGSYKEAMLLVEGEALMPVEEELSPHVIGIEYSDREDVYDLEVPKYHNFSLGSGVIVHNSADSRQIMRSRGIDSERVSADGNPEVYGALKDAFYEDRLNMYEYEPVIQELLRLEKSEKTGKVDHPSDGSKDVADALAGVVYLCAKSKPVGTVMPVKGSFDTNSRGLPHDITDLREKKREKKKEDMLDKYLDDVIEYYGW